MVFAKTMWAALVLSAALCAFPATAHAETELPTRTWNLSTQGQYNFAGFAEANTLYSNYFFTGVSSARIDCTNRSTTKNLKVQLVRDDPYVDSAVSTVYVPKNGRTVWTVSGISASKRYYLKFYAPSNFTGSIRKP